MSEDLKVYDVMKNGNDNFEIDVTDMNKQSFRSHSIFIFWQSLKETQISLQKH